MDYKQPHISIQSTIGFGWHENAASYKNSAFGPSQNDDDVEAIMNALTYSKYPYNGDRYNNLREYYINKFVTELKADLGITRLNEMFDCLYMFVTATQSDAYVNWAQPGKYDIQLVGSLGTIGSTLTFTPNCGFKSNSTANALSTLNTQFNPFTEVGANFGKIVPAVGGTQGATATSGSYGFYSSTRVNKYQTGNVYEMGAATTGGSGTLCSIYNTGRNFVYNLLQASTRTSQTSMADPYQNELGLFSFVRSNAFITEAYYNGVVVDRYTSNATIAADRGPICICNPNVGAVVGGTAVSLSSGLSSTRQIAFAYIGSADIKPEILYYRVQQYLDAIGFMPAQGGQQLYLGTNVGGNW